MYEVNLALPEATIREMKDIAVLKEMNEARVIAQAIHYYKLVTIEQLNGGKILIEKPDGTFHRIEES